MFTLKDYVVTLLDLVQAEKDFSKRQEIIDSWIDLLKAHNRTLELPKTLAILENEIEQSRELATVKVFSEESRKNMAEILKEMGIKSKIEVCENILGGVKVVFKNRLFDNTLETKIKELEKKIGQVKSQKA